MKYILLVIIMLFLSCSDHDIPIGQIEFSGFEKNVEDEHYFYLSFSSDVELIESLQKDHTGGRLNCFFVHRKINEDYFVNYKGYTLSSLGSFELVSKTSTYNYRVEAFFKLKGIDTVSANDYLRYQNALKGAFKELKKKPNCISCVVNAFTYFHFTKTYISNTMYISKKDLLEVMK